MQPLCVSAVSLNQIPLDWKGNTTRIVDALTEAARQNPDVVLFPELCITGYGCEDAFHSIDTADRALKHLQAIAEESKRILPDALIFLGLPLRKHERTYNCVAAVQGGRIRGFTAKQNLAGDGVHYEPRWFSPYRGSGDHVRIGNEDIPFGSLLYNHAGAKICVEICEDAWVVSRPAAQFIPAGLDLILNPAASHFAFGKQRIRRHIALESSRSFAAAFVMVNLLGCESGRMIYDGGSVFTSAGNLAAEGRRFSFSDFTIDTAVLDIHQNRVLRGRTHSYKDQLAAAHGSPDEGVVFVSEAPAPRRAIGFQSAGSTTTHRPKGIPENPPPAAELNLPKELEFISALTLGLFDYLRKSHSRGYVVSLSGGVDSATCAVLVQRMILHAMAELGPAPALHRLGRSDLVATQLGSVSADEQNSTDLPPARVTEIAKLVVPFLLHTIYQATSNSGNTTRDAAAHVAASLGTAHHEVDIQPAVDVFVKTTEKMIARSLTWETDDLPLQNVQARARSPMAWMLANLTGSLLLTTSNRSEAAVGYCTMDGDTSGGLAPLAGVDKAYLRRWLSWMETTGDRIGGPVPELRLVNVQAPTAELRPPSAGQTDEGDLMPYALLDLIERFAIRDRNSPAEALALLKTRCPEFPEETLRRHVRRFFQLWTRNQWKRERYAPSFHLDDENLDPKTWYRFPILSGGYEEELSEL